MFKIRVLQDGAWQEVPLPPAVSVDVNVSRLPDPFVINMYYYSSRVLVNLVQNAEVLKAAETPEEKQNIVVDQMQLLLGNKQSVEEKQAMYQKMKAQYGNEVPVKPKPEGNAVSEKPVPKPKKKVTFEIDGEGLTEKKVSFVAAMWQMLKEWTKSEKAEKMEIEMDGVIILINGKKIDKKMAANPYLQKDVALQKRDLTKMIESKREEVVKENLFEDSNKPTLAEKINVSKPVELSRSTEDLQNAVVEAKTKPAVGAVKSLQDAYAKVREQQKQQQKEFGASQEKERTEEAKSTPGLTPS